MTETTEMYENFTRMKERKEGRVQNFGKCQAFLVMTKTIKERQEKVSRSQEEKGHW